MNSLTFVIGITAAGKTHFINEYFKDKDVDILNVYDYQQKVYEENGYKNAITFNEQVRCLRRANDELIEDIIERLANGRSVVVEHTLYKAKRRIDIIEKIREQFDPNIYIYFINPSNERWEENLKLRDLLNMKNNYERQYEEIEFPNPAEGFDYIYEVVDNDIHLKINEPDEEIVKRAHKELSEERERIEAARIKKENRKKLLESMKTRPFWHYCEVCKKKEFITAEEAYNDGWDYPPEMGSFGVISPRACGSCLLTDTLYWKIQAQQSIPLVIEANLTDDEKITLKRIQNEPESLLVDE